MILNIRWKINGRDPQFPTKKKEAVRNWEIIRDR